jgi:hypothetical protein
MPVMAAFREILFSSLAPLEPEQGKPCIHAGEFVFGPFSHIFQLEELFNE